MHLYIETRQTKLTKIKYPQNTEIRTFYVTQYIKEKGIVTFQRTIFKLLPGPLHVKSKEFT